MINKKILVAMYEQALENYVKACGKDGSEDGFNRHAELGLLTGFAIALEVKGMDRINDIERVRKEVYKNESF